MDFVLSDTDPLAHSVAVAGDTLGRGPDKKFLVLDFSDLSVRFQAAMCDDRYSVLSLDNDLSLGQSGFHISRFFLRRSFLGMLRIVIDDLVRQSGVLDLDHFGRFLRDFFGG